LGYAGLAITDACSMAGVVRAYQALRDARQDGVPGADAFNLLIGSEFEVHPDPHPHPHPDTEPAATATATAADLAESPPPIFKLIVIAGHRGGYGLLCEFITRLRRAQAGKGVARLHRGDIDPALLDDCVLLLAPARGQALDAIQAHARWLRANFEGRCWLALSLHNQIDDQHWLRTLRAVSAQCGVPLVATGAVHMRARSRKPLQDVLSATRLGLPLQDCGLALQRHAEHHLRSRLRLASRYPASTLAETLNVAARCTFCLSELSYQYPEEIVPR